MCEDRPQDGNCEGSEIHALYMLVRFEVKMLNSYRM